MNPTTVLLTTDATGGVWTYSVALARGLAGKDVGVVLATMGPRPSAAQRRAVLSIPGLILEMSDYALEWIDWPWADMTAAGEWLVELERRHGPDVIHLNSYGHAGCPFRAPVVITAHACACCWWRAVYRARAPALYDRYRELVKKGFEGARAIVAPTISAWEMLEEEHGSHPKMYVIPHGLRTDASLSEPKLPFFMAAARRWDEAKNVELLRKAADELLWPVRIAGETEENGSSSKLGWLGDLDRPNLLRWMRSASVFVHPSKYEPFGMTVLEAALSGCALVLADLPSLREIWGSAALYFSPDSPAELAKKANLLAEQPSLRKNMAKSAFERAQVFSVEAMTETYLSVYRQVLKLSDGSPSLLPTAPSQTA